MDTLKEMRELTQRMMRDHDDENKNGISRRDAFWLATKFDELDKQLVKLMAKLEADLVAAERIVIRDAGTEDAEGSYAEAYGYLSQSMRRLVKL